MTAGARPDAIALTQSPVCCMMALPALLSVPFVTEALKMKHSMTRSRLALLLSVALLPALHAQQTEPPAAATTHAIHIDAVVDTKSGQPVSKLAQSDFTLLDNKAARPITSFKVHTGETEPVNVIVLIDAVNTPYQMVAYARSGIEKYLKSNEGQLAQPTAIAVLTDQGTQIDSSFTKDGNSLGDSLEHHEIGLRQITRSAEWGGVERLQICLKALEQLVAFVAASHQRTIAIWVTPGWPLISGPQIYLDSKQQNQIFGQIVALSTRLREANLTLYDVNPVGVQESLQRSDYYEVFLKGVSKPNQAQLGDLGIQVLASQTGGLVIEGNSDVAGMIQRCVTDTQTWYSIGFDPAPADKPNEYHHIELNVNQPGLAVRTRDGYYANPVAAPPR